MWLIERISKSTISNCFKLFFSIYGRRSHGFSSHDRCLKKWPKSILRASIQNTFLEILAEMMKEGTVKKCLKNAENDIFLPVMRFTGNRESYGELWKNHFSSLREQNYFWLWGQHFLLLWEQREEKSFFHFRKTIRNGYFHNSI